MATLANVQIADKSSPFDSGGAYLLAQKCDIDRIITISAEREVEVCKNSPCVVARIKGATNASDAFNESHEVVQQALDLLSAQGEAHLTARNTQDESLIWWRGPSGQVLRFISVSNMSVTMDLIGLTVTGKDGKVVPPTPQPEPTYHESLRYFRLSQVTDDLFDAFRNMYLAFESLLEYISPYKSEGEGAWVKNALAIADSKVPLTRAFKPTTSNVVEEIFSKIYVGIRCAIFHSKTGSHLVPQNLSDRKKVAEGLRILARLVLLLAAEYLHVRFPTGALTYDGFNLMTKSLFQTSAVLVTESNTPFDKAVALDSPAYKEAVPMKTEPAPDLSEPGLCFIIGSIGSADLRPLTKIGRFGITKNDKLLTDTNIEAELKYDGIDFIEAQLGLQCRYPRLKPWVSTGSIFVQDREQLLQFDPNGKFIRNFFNKGQGPGETESIDNYWLNEKNVIIHAETPNKILWINFSGERVKEFRIYGTDVFLSFLTFCRNTYYFTQSEIPLVKGEPSIVDYPQNLISLSGEGGEIKNLISFPIKSFVAVVGGSRGSLAINRLIAVPYREKHLFISHTPEYLMKLYDLEKNQVVRIFKRKYKRVETPPEIQKQGGGYVMLNNQKFTKPPQKYMNDITNLFVFKDKLWVLTSTKDKNKGILIDVYDFEGKYVDNFYLKFPNYLSLDIYNLYTMTIAGDFLYLT
jgi:hypothetical protein